MNNAWECRDQTDQAEEYYNSPLRVQNRQLEEENLMLKRLLRENKLSWPSPYACSQPPQPSFAANPAIPYLPAEIMLKILAYAMTGRDPIIDPLCKTKREHRTTQENGRGNQIAIHCLSTCKALNTEGKKSLWSNNTFIFTRAPSLKAFANVDLQYREMVKRANLRIVARFYDDENRVHTLPKDHHHMMAKAIRLKVNKRAKEPTLARRGFRSYGWFQLVDFLEALLPPHDPSHDLTQPRKRLLPKLEKLRIDFINFGDDIFQFPPAQLHDVASHHLGCYLNELIVTGLPRDDTGHRTGSELCGLLKDDGLFVDHAPTYLALKNGLRHLPGNHFHPKVVRSMRPSRGIKHHHHDDHPGYFDEFLPAPPDEGATPYSPYFSCRTIWKMVPDHIDKPRRKWTLFDRVSGLPWEDIEEEATMFDYLDDSDDEDGMMCENCGEIHPGAILPDDLMDDLYDDM